MRKAIHWREIAQPSTTGEDARPAARVGGLVWRRADVAAGALFGLTCAALFRFTADDAFIVQRYALQFVRGHGLVFNIGERVSALTSPLHALVLTALTLMSPSPMVAYKVVGAVAALVAILYAGSQTVRRRVGTGAVLQRHAGIALRRDVVGRRSRNAAAPRLRHGRRGPDACGRAANRCRRPSCSCSSWRQRWRFSSGTTASCSLRLWP